MANEVLEQPQVGSGGTDTAPSLRESLERAVEANPIEAPQPDRETREQSLYNPADTRTQAQRDRDERGRFAPKAPAGAEVPTQGEVDAASRIESPQEEQHDETQSAPSPSIDNAPKSWKAGPREKWSGLDPDVRAEIHRRERESTRAISESAPVKRFAQTFQETVAPFRERYASSGLPPLEIFKNLMNADTLLATAPMPQRAQFMAKMIQDYGIDVRQLDAALSGGDPGEEPLAVVESLINQKLAPVQQYVQQANAQREAQTQQEYNRQQQAISAMAADTQNYPHFDLVTGDMADIMEMNARRRVYLSPEEAYKRAVAGNPEAQAAEQGRAGQQRAKSAHDAATRSLGASLSVSGSPAGLRQQVAPDDLRGTIAAAWQAHSGR